MTKLPLSPTSFVKLFHLLKGTMRKLVQCCVALPPLAGYIEYPYCKNAERIPYPSCVAPLALAWKVGCQGLIKATASLGFFSVQQFSLR